MEFILQCSGGIPRQINNLCDNAMLYAYSADTRTVDRTIVEDVAANLDMLPDPARLLAAEISLDKAPQSRVLSNKGREELVGSPDDMGRIKKRGFEDIVADREVGS
jgi:hypothetical protein